MTDDEIEIGTFRYRAPPVIALSSGQFAVLCAGWTPEVRVCGHLELHSIITQYTEWNVLPEPTVTRRKATKAETLAALGVTDAELDEALAAVRMARKDL